MSSTDEPTAIPPNPDLIASYEVIQESIEKPTASFESIKADANRPNSSMETVRLSEYPQPQQNPPDPSVDYEKKSL